MHLHLPRRSRLRRMFWHDRLRRLFWDDKWGKTVTGLWGTAGTQWIVIGCLWVLVWRHGHAVLHHGAHPPGIAVAAALLPVLGVVGNPRRAGERNPARPCRHARQRPPCKQGHGLPGTRHDERQQER
jgi:hypothetical protein